MLVNISEYIGIHEQFYRRYWRFLHIYCLTLSIKQFVVTALTLSQKVFRSKLTQFYFVAFNTVTVMRQSWKVFCWYLITLMGLSWSSCYRLLFERLFVSGWVCECWMTSLTQGKSSWCARSVFNFVIIYTSKHL